MTNPKVIGIDIGGTNIVFGVVDHEGHILKSGKLSTKGNDKIEEFVDALYRRLRPVLDQGRNDILGIGVGAPDVNYYRNTIEYAHNLPWTGIVPLGKMLKSKFNLPVQLTNDAKAAAAGEMAFGLAKGMKDFIMITLGTGLGSAIVSNGKIIYGHDGFAGELGHVIVKEDGRSCGCGRNGCLETYASATGLIKTTRNLLVSRKATSLLLENGLDALDGERITRAAKKGDKIANEAIDITARIFGKALANFIPFSSPESIILFGGLANAGDLILKPTKKYMEANLLSLWKDKIDIVCSEFKESEAAILGASALIWNGS